MLAVVPFRKPLLPVHHQLTKHLMPPSQHSSPVGEPVPMRFPPSSPVESRRPREREEPCSFRTRLVDPDSPIMFNSTDKLDCNDIKFDDTQCISVSRSTTKFAAVLRRSVSPMRDRESRHHREDLNEGVANRLGPDLYSVPNDTLSPQEGERPEPAAFTSTSNCSTTVFTPVEEHQDTDLVDRISRPALPRGCDVFHNDNDNNNNNDGGDSDEGDMETMNMPFWHAPKRQKRYARHPAADSIPDDMSIISDVSLIPTYFPSDIMKQQRTRHRHVLKRLLVAKARAARQTMRQLKRSCRDAVGTVFVEPAAPCRSPKCVPVGSAL